jgi:hypothetical protein
MKKAMARGIGAAVLAASLMVAPVLIAPASFTAQAVCDPGDRIDNVTAEMAKRRVESAGYSQVRMEHKGCDNTWHGFAVKGGASMRVAVSPSGEVMPEGD